MAITLGANEPHHSAESPRDFRAVIGSALVPKYLLCYGFSDRLAAFIGEKRHEHHPAAFFFLLVCIGVQILWNGAPRLVTISSAGY